MPLNEEDHEVNHFDQMSDSYDSNYGYNSIFFQYKKQKKLDQCIQFLKSTNKKMAKVLEIGAGTGEYTLSLAKALPKSQIIATDISKKMLSVARKKNKSQKNIQYLKMNAYKLKFSNNLFDAVVGFYVLHHLSDLNTVFLEIERVLKPNGLVYFIEPNILNPIVFIIKKIKFIKKMVGDSPDESAINPIGFNKYLPKSMKIVFISGRELVPGLPLIGDKNKIKLDLIVKQFEQYPVLKYLGGSIEICLEKKV